MEPQVCVASNKQVYAPLIHSIYTVSPMDYGALSTTLMFDTCETRKCTNIAIANDDIPEGTESFTITLERTPGLDDRITLDPVDGEIQISDRDGIC